MFCCDFWDHLGASMSSTELLCAKGLALVSLLNMFIFAMQALAISFSP